MQRVHRVLAALAVLVVALSCSPASQFPVEKYELAGTQGTWVMEFNGDGTWSRNCNRGSPRAASGTNTVDGNRITFCDISLTDSDDPSCPGIRGRREPHQGETGSDTGARDQSVQRTMRAYRGRQVVQTSNVSAQAPIAGQ